MTFTSPNGQRYDWWNFPTVEQRGKVLVDYLKALEMDQSARRLQWVQFSRMYQNQNPMQYYNSLSNSATAQGQVSQWSSRNVIKSCVDTATSKIGKNRPRPVFLTEDGDWSQQQRAKKLTQFTDGQFDAMRLYEKAAQVFRDAGIFGIGGMKFSVNTQAGSVECERVLIDEIFVDDADAVYGSPSQINHIKFVSKTALKAKFPGKEKIIDNAMSAFKPIHAQSRMGDLVRVFEAYRLPSKPGAKDGKKILAVEGGVLQEDTWEKDYFPFVFFRWCDRISGFWGVGIAEELYGTQLEINKLLRNIQLAQSLVAIPRVFVRPGAMPTVKLDNNIGAVVTTPTTPDFMTPQAMTGEIYNHLKWLVQSAYDQIGISEMSATGNKPQGLDSGVAIREYEDAVSERFMVVGQKWDQFHLDCAKITIDLNKDLMEMGKSPSVKIVDKDFLDTLDWSKIDLPEDKYTLRCFSASLLPTTPAGRLAKIQELLQAGIIPIEEALRLMDMPDLKAYRNQALASDDLADKMIESCLNGKFIAPEPQMNLQRALSTAQMRYLEAKLNNAPSSGLAALNRWMEAVKGLLPAAPVPVSPMAPMEQTPGAIATPEAAPQSPLLPFNQ